MKSDIPASPLSFEKIEAAYLSCVQGTERPKHWLVGEGWLAAYKAIKEKEEKMPEPVTGVPVVPPLVPGLAPPVAPPPVQVVEYSYITSFKKAAIDGAITFGGVLLLAGLDLVSDAGFMKAHVPPVAWPAIPFAVTLVRNWWKNRSRPPVALAVEIKR